MPETSGTPDRTNNDNLNPDGTRKDTPRPPPGQPPQPPQPFTGHRSTGTLEQTGMGGPSTSGGQQQIQGGGALGEKAAPSVDPLFNNVTVDQVKALLAQMRQARAEQGLPCDVCGVHPCTCMAANPVTQILGPPQAPAALAQPQGLQALPGIPGMAVGGGAVGLPIGSIQGGMADCSNLLNQEGSEGIGSGASSQYGGNYCPQVTSVLTTTGPNLAGNPAPALGGTVPNLPPNSATKKSLLPQSYLKSVKIELFSGDAASPPFREWFPKFDRYAQAHGIPVEMRGEALCFALEGPALEFVTNSGWCNQTKNYQLLARALNHEFPTLTPAAYATQLHQAKQFPDEQIAQFIRRVQRLIYQAYPGIQPVLASQMAVTAVRNGCMVRYRPVLDPMGPELGIEYIKNTLINYEQNRGFDYIKQGFNRANNGQKYNQQPGIMALQAAQGNTPEENEKSVLEDALLSEDEPLTMYQVRQVIKENTAAMAKETTKAVAEANKQLESTVKEIRKQVDGLKPTGNKGNGNGQRWSKGWVQGP
jgi:hypothetical protein